MMEQIQTPSAIERHDFNFKVPVILGGLKITFTLWRKVSVTQQHEKCNMRSPGCARGAIYL